MRTPMRAGLLAVLVATVPATPAVAQIDQRLAKPDGVVRVATFNASLNRRNAGDLARELAAPGAAQPSLVAEIIQRVQPDILLINEFDYDSAHEAAELFRRNYLAQGVNGASGVDYPHVFVAPSNTGIPTGMDLDRDGKTGPGDAYGFGYFPGQYGMVILSRFPIDADRARTFQNFLWNDMPGARLPDDPTTPAPADYYGPEALEIFRLSSKSHWDVPVTVGGRTLHVLASHPTPPVFDGPEDRNGTRNADEVRFFLDYVTPGHGDYIYDDRGGRGGLAGDASFVLLGDQNLESFDGDGLREVARHLVGSPRIQDPRPASAGGPEAARTQGLKNLEHTGDPALDTADFGDDPARFGAGNMRVDYVLPSADLQVVGAGVFWPTTDDPLRRLIGDDGLAASDHRLVWVDLKLD